MAPRQITSACQPDVAQISPMARGWGAFIRLAALSRNPLPAQARTVPTDRTLGSSIIRCTLRCPRRKYASMDTIIRIPLPFLRIGKSYHAGEKYSVVIRMGRKFLASAPPPLYNIAIIA